MCAPLPTGPAASILNSIGTYLPCPLQFVFASMSIDIVSIIATSACLFVSPYEGFDCSVHAQGRPPIYKQVAPFYPTQTASVPTTYMHGPGNCMSYGGVAVDIGFQMGCHRVFLGPPRLARVYFSNLAQQHGGRAFQRNMRLGLTYQPKSNLTSNKEIFDNLCFALLALLFNGIVKMPTNHPHLSFHPSIRPSGHPPPCLD